MMTNGAMTAPWWVTLAVAAFVAGAWMATSLEHDRERDREREMIAGVQDVSSRFGLLQRELRMHLMLDTELQRRCGLPVLVVE